MILQALSEYYNRKATDKNSNIAPEGWEWKEIPFLAIINENGDFICFKDTREEKDKKKRAHQYLVPTLGEKKGNGIKSNLLWENIEYMFGIPVPSKVKPIPDYERVKAQHNAFLDKINSLSENNILLKAVKRFCTVDQSEIITKDQIWNEVLSLNQNLLLAIEQSDTVSPITDIPEIRIAVNQTNKGSNKYGICLISGENTEIVRLEPSIKGVSGSDRKAERALISFNNDSFCSYRKEKNFNSPIGKTASFTYSTALNILLGKDSQNKVYIGDSTTIFWAEKIIQSFDLEHEFAWYIADSPKEDPDRGIKAIKALYEAAYSGQLPLEEGNRFYVLGLSPNAARISVRFWKVGTVREFAEKIKMHFDDFEIFHGPAEPEYLCLNKILRAIAFEYKIEKAPPNLAGDIVASILDGSPYPSTLLHQCIRRIRAEVARKGIDGKSISNVTRTRAAILKAFLNRNKRIHNKEYKEIKMALDYDNNEVGYVLGRLFALLEKIQEESARPNKLNSTIRERYYSSLSSSPTVVLPLLMRLKNHHLAKLNGGLKNWYENKLAEVVNHLKAKNIPSHLTMEQQALFAVGYYHQKIHSDKK